MTDFRRWIFATAVLSLSAELAGAQPYLISTVAGGLPAPSAVPGTNYSFESPNAVATDLFGNTYISTTYHCVFRLDPKGNLSRVAGTCQQGFSGDGGNAVKAQLNNPAGLAVDVLGNLYIADTGNQRVRRVTPAGIISTIAGTGTAGYNADSIPATTAQLNNPQGLSADSSGNLYIADSANHRVRRIAIGGTIATVAGTGTLGNAGDSGPATAATLTTPNGLTLDSSGNLYVSDSGAKVVRMVNSSGTIFRFAGTGSSGNVGDLGPATAASLSNPQGLAVDSAGNVYIADEGTARIRKVDLTGTISTFAGNGAFGLGGDGGPATSAQLLFPVGLGVDYSRDVFIADLAGMVRMVNSSGTIQSVAGNGASPLPFSGDGGNASLGQFATPWGIARDGSGNIYIADWKGARIRKIDANGTLSTVAGTGTGSDTGDGAQASAANVTPQIVAVDALGNLYLTGLAKIRKIATNGVISTVAGTGTFGYSGDGQAATAANLQSYLPGLAVDANQNIYISDWSNQRVRKVVAATGNIVTVAGTGTAGYSGDGQVGAAAQAQVNFPAGLAVDGNGNLYISDNGNCVVRKLLVSNSTISTVVGNGTCGSTGDGGPATAAEIRNPWAIAVDGGGNLYVATQDNNIRKVTAAGVISTIGGNGTSGYSGDGGPATSAQLAKPLGLALDPSGNLYVADYANAAIRVLHPQTEPLLTISSTNPGVFAAGQNGVFTIATSNAAQAATTSGTVTVTATLPASVTPVSMGGTGWSCSYTAPAYSCQNSGTLAAGQSFGNLSLTVNVAQNAPAQVTIQLTVSGGGSLGAGAVDSAFVGSLTPVLLIAVTHGGNFLAGGQGTFNINVANQMGAASTTSTVSVTDTLPSGLSLASIGGTGWGCTGTTCTNPGVLGGGAGYSPLTVTVNVASNASSPLINSATVSGGGSSPATASDTISVGSGACFITGGSTVSAADLQALINEGLGISSAAHDVNQDHVVNVVDIQIVANAALRLGCTI